ncbi:hypothetical protein OEZ85_008976 [Tetradesmus obliquus]|uniref:CinA C-terminal domain-containing protein n=1 Tax=Tetradesmus obliquus TaxID=3088 RepID=A0ABY8TKD4_TETOB|nr:hypothetical protein OEZ85_008976 [Tetradesmus obliquus]
MTVPPPVSSEPAQEESKKLSPGARLSEALSPTSTSITIIGDDTQLNWAVCQALAKKIGWFPVSTARILTGMNKAGTVEEIVQKQGREALAQAEAGVLKGMKDQFRVCVATVGDGAAADPNLYDYMYGSIIIWLDEVDKRKPKPPSAAREVYLGRSEVRASLSVAGGGFGEKPLTLEEKATKATGYIIKAMHQLLKEHDYLPQKKRLYVEYGCRGDWPELKPKEWNPVLESLERKPVPEA